MIQHDVTAVGFLQNSIWSLAHRIISQEYNCKKKRHENVLPHSFKWLLSITVRSGSDGRAGLHSQNRREGLAAVWETRCWLCPSLCWYHRPAHQTPARVLFQRIGILFSVYLKINCNLPVINCLQGCLVFHFLVFLSHFQSFHRRLLFRLFYYKFNGSPRV